MTNRVTRPLVVFGAFLGSLVVGLTVVLWLLGGGLLGGLVASPSQRRSAVHSN